MQKIRSVIWPIYGREHRKFIPMFFLFFLISFVYSLLRNMKMALLITADSSGAEVVPFMKTIFIFPSALLMTYLFTKLTNHFSREKVFYAILSSFILYFVVFTVLLFPCRDALELCQLAGYLEQVPIFSHGLHGVIAIIRHWNLALFYVLSEMWSVVILSMLFWGFANEVTKVEEAKRFYALFALGSNISAIFVGLYTSYVDDTLSAILPLYQNTGDSWVGIQLITVIICGVAIFYLFYKLNNRWLDLNNTQILQIPKKSNKISLLDCIKILKQSSYVRYLVIIVVCYNMVHNLSDVVWTAQVRVVYPESQAYNHYVAQVSSITGAVAVVLALVVSSPTIRCYGWTVAALVTPVAWIITGIPFYTGMYTEWCYSILLGVTQFFSNPEGLILLLGTLQVVVGRGCKYTIFDGTKEMSFIPLSQDDKRKAKAVVDGIASRAGKSASSILYILLLSIFGSFAPIVPYVFGIWIIALGLWIWAVISLGRIVKQHLVDPDLVLIPEHNISNKVTSETAKPVLIS